MVLDRLIELRKSKRWSIQHTADLLGIAKSTYAGYESGYREPSLEAVKLLADLFETSVDYLLGRESSSNYLRENLNAQLDLTTVDAGVLTVDGIELTENEILHLVAFIRAKRELESAS